MATAKLRSGSISSNALKPIMLDGKQKPLIFEIISECRTTKARTGKMTLVHHQVDTPVFMPVGTQVIKFFIIFYL